MQTEQTQIISLKSGAEVQGTLAQLTDDVMRRLGYAFACWLAERDGRTPDVMTLAVGRDPRPGGARLKAALIRGITAADSDVLDCDLCTLPALYAAVNADGADGAMLVHSSSPDPAHNGLRLFTRQGGLTDEALSEVLARAENCSVPQRLVTPHDAAAPYWQRLRERAAMWLEDDALRPLLGVRVAIDARGLAGRDFRAFIEDLGAETDGSLPYEEGFVADVEDEEAARAIGRAVVEHRCDMGLLFSAAGDRLRVLNDRGEPLDGNRLIALASALLLNAAPGGTVVTDSVTSSGLSAFIAEWGGIHYRFKRGYHHVIGEAARLNAEGIDCPLAIETSGHSAFRDNGFIDDSFYLATRLVCQALDRKREGENLFALLEGLQEPVESIDLRLPLRAEDPAAASQEVVEAILSHTLEDPAWQPAPDNREGVRITFNLDGGINNAWFQLRMSVYRPEMPLKAESAVPGGVQRILGELYEVIRDMAVVELDPLKAALEARE